MWGNINDLTLSFVLIYFFFLFISAFPSCANADLHTVVEVERHKATQLNCQYHSSSVGAAPLEFRWSMNSSNDYVDIPKVFVVIGFSGLKLENIDYRKVASTNMR